MEKSLRELKWALIRKVNKIGILGAFPLRQLGTS